MFRFFEHSRSRHRLKGNRCFALSRLVPSDDNPYPHRAIGLRIPQGQNWLETPDGPWTSGFLNQPLALGFRLQPLGFLINLPGFLLGHFHFFSCLGLCNLPLGLLNGLIARGLLRYDRSLTNREYLRSVAHVPELAGVLQDVVNIFDRVWYGYQPITPETYDRYAAQVQALRRRS